MGNRRIKKPSEAKGPRLTEAPEEVLKRLARLVDENHSGLAEAKISVWMVNGNWRKKGEVVDADCQVVTGANRKETGNIFRLFINNTLYNNSPEKMRDYMIDNQLTRCCKGETGNGEARWYVQDYTVKAFPDVIERYGLITPEIKQLNQVLTQGKLFDEKGVPVEQHNAAVDTGEKAA